MRRILRDETRPTAPPTSSHAPDPVDAPTESTLLVWTSGGLTADLPAQVAALETVEALTTVFGDLVDLVATYDDAGRPVDMPAPGLRIPLDALATDTSSYPAFVDEPDRDAIAALGAGEALLGETSARLRRLGPGATVVLGNGTRLTVDGVVSDDAVGAAELIVAGSEGPAVGVTTPRFLLVAYRGDRADDRAGDRGVATGEAGPVPGPGRDTIPPPRRPRAPTGARQGAVR